MRKIDESAASRIADVNVFSATIKIDLKYSDLKNPRRVREAMSIDVDETKTLSTFAPVSWLVVLVSEWLPLLLVEVVHIAMYRAGVKKESWWEMLEAGGPVEKRVRKLIGLVLPKSKRPVGRPKVSDLDRSLFLVKVENAILECRLAGCTQVSDFQRKVMEQDETVEEEHVRDNFRSAASNRGLTEGELNEMFRAALSGK